MNLESIKLPKGEKYRRICEEIIREVEGPVPEVLGPQLQSYPETREVFRFALTETMHWMETCLINVQCFPHQIFALYKKIPSEKYKSADELIEWAEQHSIPAPRIELLRQCLAAKTEFQLPNPDDQELCRRFLIRYMRAVGEVCMLKFPPNEWKSPYAIDYLVDDPDAFTHSDANNISCK